MLSKSFTNHLHSLQSTYPALYLVFHSLPSSLYLTSLLPLHQEHPQSTALIFECSTSPTTPVLILLTPGYHGGTPPLASFVFCVGFGWCCPPFHTSTHTEHQLKGSAT